MLIHPVQSSERYPIGSVIEAYAPPNDNWLLCNGQILLQSEYSSLYEIMDDPHPTFQNWEILKGAWSDYGVYQVVYDGSQYVGCGRGRMVYSSNGASWTEVTLPTYSTRIFNGLGYDGSIFVSVADYTTPITDYVTSTDGQNWTERSLPTAIEGRTVLHDGTYFYLISYDDGHVLYSSDGTTWNSATILPDTTWYGHAASPDAIVAVSTGGYLAVSKDKGTTWKFYDENTGGYMKEIYYDAAEDIFVGVHSTYPVISISPGDDGVNWEQRHIDIPNIGNVRHWYYESQTFNRIKKAGNYWFTLSWGGQQAGFSSDLKVWNTFPILENDWYDAFYDAATEYYYIIGYGSYYLRWKEVTNYNSSTHFMLPNPHDQYDFHSMTKRRKYIRVK